MSQAVAPTKQKLNYQSSDSDDSVIENYMTHMYADDRFLTLRKEYEEQLVNDAREQVERQHLIHDMDETLADLMKWKAERAKAQN